MNKQGTTFSAVVLTAVLVATVATGSAYAAPLSPSTTPSSVEQPRADLGGVQLAQDNGSELRELQPRYESAQPAPKSSFNDDYIFALTRGVADSTMNDAAKAFLFPVTVPLDLVMLPFSLIGGLFV